MCRARCQSFALPIHAIVIFAASYRTMHLPKHINTSLLVEPLPTQFLTIQHCKASRMALFGISRMS